MTERDMEDVLAEMLNERNEVDIGFGPVRVTHARAFGSRMLTLNRGVTLEVEWEEEIEPDGDPEPDGPKVETQRAEFQLIIHRGSR
jgi:hypothetical protein